MVARAGPALRCRHTARAVGVRNGDCHNSAVSYAGFLHRLPSAPNLSLYCWEEGQVSDFRALVTCCSWVTVTGGWHSVQGGPRLHDGAGTGQQGGGRRLCLLDI